MTKVSKCSDKAVTQSLSPEAVETPAFVYDMDAIRSSLEGLSSYKGCSPLYSIKSLSCEAVLKLAAEMLCGLSVSSLFEARWARELTGPQTSLHLTTPGLRDAQATELARLCDYLSFNSLQQLERMHALVQSQCSTGLRINPQQSLVDDQRYDPCRPASKLGVPVPELKSRPDLWPHIEGLHFHNNFAGTDLAPLLVIIETLISDLPDLFRQIRWLNLGGGYLYDEIQERDALTGLLQDLQDEYGLQVFIEPGKALVDNAGYLLASVIDLFERDGQTIAVLDTSVNHLPEVFEYQWRPHLLNETGEHSCLLVGSTCLSGDLFGEYRFEQPVQLGQRIIFARVGAYSLVKASRFNGHPLPNQYLLQGDRLEQQYTDSYDSYRSLWAAQ